MILCPECVQGKHRNCDGRTWDFDNDDYRACECPDEEHQ